MTGSPVECLHRLAIGGRLLVLGRRRGPLEEQELGAEQADAACPERACRRRLAGRADVGQQRDLHAVPRHARERDLGQVGRACLGEPGRARVKVGHGRRIGRDEHLARRPVQRQLGVRAGGLERAQDPVRPHDRRDPVGPGEDRGVGRRGSCLEDDPEDVLAGQRGGQRRREVLGDHDRRRGQERLLDRQAGEQARDPVRDVDHVGGTRGQDLVVEGREHRGDLRTGGHDRGHAVLELVADPRRGRVDQRRVPGHRRVGHEDRGLVVVAGGAHALREGHEVVRRLVRRRAKPGLLGLDRVRGNPATHRELAPSHVHPCATRHARRRGDAGQPPTLRHCHPCNSSMHAARGAPAAATIVVDRWA